MSRRPVGEADGVSSAADILADAVVFVMRNDLGQAEGWTGKTPLGKGVEETHRWYLQSL